MISNLYLAANSVSAAAGWGHLQLVAEDRPFN